MTGPHRPPRGHDRARILATVALFVVVPALLVFAAGVILGGSAGLFGGYEPAARQRDPIPTPAAPQTETVESTARVDRPGQDMYVQSVAVDRQTMHTGTASARIRRYAQVNQVFEVDLLVCGPKAGRCATATPAPAGAAPPPSSRPPALPASPRPVPPTSSGPVRPVPSATAASPGPDGGSPGAPDPRGTPTPLGEVLTGGRVRATLTALDPAIQVRGGDPAVQLVLDRADVGEWRWSVQADRSGTFNLAVMVVTLRGETDEALTPPRYFDFSVEVRDTFSTRAVGATRDINSFLAAGGAGLATLVTAGVGVLAYRRGRDLDQRMTPAAPFPGGGRVRSVVLVDHRVRRRRRAGFRRRRPPER